MLRASDAALVAVARSLILARFEPNRHVVGCALRTRGGRVHAGVHLECHLGRIAVCAEAVAIGRAATEGDGHEIETIVAVYCTAADVEPAVVSPCGMCREMISDYAPAARVIVPGVDGPRIVRVSRLLPGKFARPDTVTPQPPAPQPVR
jgi:cytidine deaminase